MNNNMKCKYCGIKHHNTTKDSNFAAVGGACMRCDFIVGAFNASISAINMHIPFGSDRPRRKITIEGFKIEKI